ncbi:hypothetical protein C1645_878001 [Glomus cerebriforme]|uniref:F-box domain-containing protein n=1 Tax=Glomus cerebriforme TaxID=658196 RepID=A0A397SRI1_9GLOM|nr:hypothetical protein C1645_878001 [Glomus cerebriforme]
MNQLPADCLNEIFKYLDEDKVVLQSTLLVNRLWSEISVRELWKSIININTLIDCIPNESKEILRENGILILTSKHPMFNYPSFCKSLSVNQLNYKIKQWLNRERERQSNSIQNFNDKLYLLTKEIFKLLMSQIYSLRKLEFTDYSPLKQNIIFTSYPGAKDCLNDLSVLHCDSDIYPEFYYQLSQICQNLQLLYVSFKKVISNGLSDLISVQNNLKYLYMFQYYDCKELTPDIITSLKKLPNTLTKLNIYGGDHYIPLSFISNFKNLQELILSFRNIKSFEDFKLLQHVTFPQLYSLEFKYEHPRNELLMNFLENNGKNLKNFKFIKNDNNLLNLAIIKYCPNIRKLSGLTNNDTETLQMFFEGCQSLEIITIYCKRGFSEKEIFDVIVKYSPKSFYELQLNYLCDPISKIFPHELESFFIKWANRIPQKPLSLIIIDNGSYSSMRHGKNKNVIEKYVKLGIINIKK